MINAIATPILPKTMSKGACTPPPATESAAEAAPTESVQLSGGVAPSASQGMAQTALQTAQEVASKVMPSPQAVTFKVLSLNTYFDCRQGIDKIANMIKESGADLVGLQESIRNTRALAKAVGMNWVQQDVRTALLSKHPIEKTSKERYGVVVKLPGDQKVGFLNAHLTSFPNQPHQLCHLPGAGGPFINTEEEAIAEAEKARGEEFDVMLAEADQLGVPNLVATGDFNEPSHLDWTPRAAEAGLHPMKVDWPGSRKYEKAGFIDSYREAFPNEVTHPGNTWTSWKPDDDPETKHDRIDFIHHRGPNLHLRSIQILGERPEKADIVFDPYPTDHRSLLATFDLLPE